MSSTILIITIFFACIIGIKKPLYGGIAGAIIAPIMFCILAPFNLIYFLVYIFTGFVLSLGCSFVVSLIFSGTRGKQHTGPSMIGQSGGHGYSEHTGGIILSDEEREGIGPPKRASKMHK